MSALPQTAAVPTTASKLPWQPGILRASLAVTKRHLLTFVRYPSWFLAMLIWPVLMPFNFIFAGKALAGPQGEGLAAFASLAGTADYVGFVVVGTTFWMWFNSMLWGLGTAFRNEQMRGTLESNWLAPVPKVFVALGSFLGDSIVGLAVLVLATGSLALVYGVRMAADPLALLLVVLASVPSIYGIGLAFASLVLTVKEANAAVFFIRGLMTVFCGITYPIAVLPAWMQPISAALPLTHSIQGVRMILAGSDVAGVSAQLRYLGISGALLLALGFGIFEMVQRRMITAGTLGQY